MNELNSETLIESLNLLGEVLDLEKADPVHLVVVGGSALLVAGIVSRTTQDVDVIAERGIPEGEIVPIRQLSPDLRDAAERVAKELGLPKNWINATTALFSVPLQAYPPDLWHEMERREFGTRLEVSFLGRGGLIYLKFYAALDSERKRRKDDREDLVRLAPTRDEANRAIRWLRTEELLTEGHSAELLDLLTQLGHEDLVS